MTTVASLNARYSTSRLVASAGEHATKRRLSEGHFAPTDLGWDEGPQLTRDACRAAHHAYLSTLEGAA